MNLATVIEGIERQAFKYAVESPADYVGENGLLYCGNCHTAKQHREKPQMAFFYAWQIKQSCSKYTVFIIVSG